MWIEREKQKSVGEAVPIRVSYFQSRYKNCEICQNNEESVRNMNGFFSSYSHAMCLHEINST